MPELTTSSMHDAGDAEDTRLLAAGEWNALIESYLESIILRCRVRCRTEDEALGCAQSVALRLLSELKRGRSYGVPYRVVVHKVIEWTTKGFYARGRAILVEIDENLPDDVFRAGNPFVWCYASARGWREVSRRALSGRKLDLSPSNQAHELLRPCFLRGLLLRSPEDDLLPLPIHRRLPQCSPGSFRR